MKSRLFLLAAVAAWAWVAEAPARTWSDRSGEFEVEAELVVSKGGIVRLRKTDGKVISVPLRRLSDADQEFLREQAKQASEKTSAATPAGPNVPFHAVITIHGQTQEFNDPMSLFRWLSQMMNSRGGANQFGGGGGGGFMGGGRGPMGGGQGPMGGGRGGAMGGGRGEGQPGGGFGPGGPGEGGGGFGPGQGRGEQRGGGPGREQRGDR